MPTLLRTGSAGAAPIAHASQVGHSRRTGAARLVINPAYKTPVPRRPYGTQQNVHRGRSQAPFDAAAQESVTGTHRNTRGEPKGPPFCRAMQETVTGTQHRSLSRGGPPRGGPRRTHQMHFRDEPAWINAGILLNLHPGQRSTRRSCDMYAWSRCNAPESSRRRQLSRAQRGSTRRTVCDRWRDRRKRRH